MFLSLPRGSSAPLGSRGFLGLQTYEAGNRALSSLKMLLTSQSPPCSATEVTLTRTSCH